MMISSSINSLKVYVEVKALFWPDGTLLPVEITWEDGRKYLIDKIIEIRRAPSARAGGIGDRYTIMVRGRKCYLFFERNKSISGNNIGRWFVERRYSDTS